jgi:hypothetical protein
MNPHSEKHEIEQFIKISNLFKIEEIEFGDSPDAIANKRIGIEHTSLIPDGSINDLKRRSVKIKIRDAAFIKYKQQYYEYPIDVHLLLNYVDKFHKNEEIAASQIVEILQSEFKLNNSLMKRYNRLYRQLGDKRFGSPPTPSILN